MRQQCVTAFNLPARLAVAASLLLIAGRGDGARAQSFSVVATFENANGANPGGGLLLSRNGTLYGTAAYGGSGGFGVVYKIRPGFEFAKRAVDALHSFDGDDGAFPQSSLTAAPDGTLYGTTSNTISTYGTIFKVDPATGAVTAVYAFANGADGGLPNAGLILDGRGGAYGTTTSGALGYGTAFRFDLETNALTTLHSFDGTDGAYPFAGLTFDRAGALWGVAPAGGANGAGVLFKLDPKTQAYDVKLMFGGANGVAPEAPPAIAPDGVLYGSTAVGGISADCVAAGSPFAGCGVLYAFDPRDGSYAVLHSFTGQQDGGAPEAQLTFGWDGALYGTTFLGGLTQDCTVATGIPPGCGTVFRFDPETNELRTLHAFTGGADGANPFAPVLVAWWGELFGVANAGGDAAACPSTAAPSGCGTVWRMFPDWPW